MPSNRHGTIVKFVGLVVSNRESVRDFYSQVCGWKIEDHPAGSEMECTLTSASGDLLGEILAPGTQTDVPSPHWLTWIYVDDLDVAITNVLAQGGRVISDRQDIGKGERIATVADPEGTPIGLLESTQIEDGTP